MKKQLDQLSVYAPGLSPDTLKKKYGIEGELYKLASNENLYGPPPKVKEAIKAQLDNLYLLPRVRVTSTKRGTQQASSC
ncbi:hypothetical protein [Staphylococcus saccharolyticus]|uniref:hypothetical protein n=1 Tax=Staphylococcus saccharolyticus TaxID=33028 RepID=UPI001F5BFEF9|nr:hypothetical protein [Staphylococcus saccharolyticus]